MAIPPGWYPWKIIPEKKLISWSFIGDKRFTESFYEETLRARLHLPENTSFSQHVSSLETFPHAAARADAVQPAAFIFHISRCGSTLLSQLLAMDPAAIVLSEVPALDQLLAYARKENLDFAATKDLVPAMINILGRKRDPQEKHVYVKLDSWHIFYHDLLRKIFPQTPFLFLYRRPDEVFRSHLRRPGMHMAPGLMDTELFGITEEIKAKPQQYMAEVLNRYLQEISRIAQADPLATIADYHEGMETITLQLLDRIGIVPPQKWREELKARLAYHSKYPDRKFEGDAETVFDPSLPEPAMETWRQLERLRMNVAG